jgi:anti-sigma-K factor RskA
MHHEEHQKLIDLLPAFALGSLDADEARLVEQHLTTCEVCQSELAAFQSVADALPLAAADVVPPPALKKRLMEQVQAPAKLEGVVTSTAPSIWQQLVNAVRRFFAGPRWQPVALLLIVALATSNVLLWRQLNQPPSSSARRFRLTGTEAAPDATGIVYLSRDGRDGSIIVDNLEPLPPDKQYQLWLIRDGERTSGAVFSVTDTGYHSQLITAPRPLEEYSAFGITVEPAGGSPGPTGERVLGYDLDP